MRSQGKLLPPKLEKQADTETHNLLEQKLCGKVLCGNQYWGRKTKTIIDESLEVWCRQIWEWEPPGKPSHSRSPNFGEFYLQDLNHVLTLKIKEKSPWVSSMGRGKEIIWKNTRESVLNKACPREKLFYQSLFSFFQSQTDLKKRKYLTLVGSSHPVSPTVWGREGWEANAKLTV